MREKVTWRRVLWADGEDGAASANQTTTTTTVSQFTPKCLLLHSSQSSSLINIRIIYHFLYFVDNPENPIHHQRVERQFAVHQVKIDL
jgi:hypothetical protein